MGWCGTRRPVSHDHAQGRHHAARSSRVVPRLLSGRPDRLGPATCEPSWTRWTLIRWSSTITSNALGEQQGRQAGAAGPAGHERTSTATGRRPRSARWWPTQTWSESPRRERAGRARGHQPLLEDGIRRIYVSLDSFPETLAGAASSGSSRTHTATITWAPCQPAGQRHGPARDGQTRTHYALINAYVHRPAGHRPVHGRGPAPLRAGMDRHAADRAHQRGRRADR